MPLYPMIDDRNNTPSANEIKQGFVWNQKSNEAGWKMYLGNYMEQIIFLPMQPLLEQKIIVIYHALTHVLVNWTHSVVKH